MSPLTREQINTIAESVAAHLGNIAPQPVTPAHPAATPSQMGDGIFYQMDDAVSAARKAHLQLLSMTLKKRDEIIGSIRTSMREHSRDLAKRAHEETGLGRYEDKIEKNNLIIEKTPGTEALQPITWTGDRGLTLVERAPFGVIGSITPTTNPTSTIIGNTIGMVAAGNAVVFNVHPSAKTVSVHNIQLLNKAITAVGGPPNLVTAISEPTIDSAQQLMTHPGIDLLVVTGGAGVVKAAMSSGKRALCAGPGNPPVVVDETADFDHAAKSIVTGASMDNNIICVTEKEVFVVDSVADKLLAAFKKQNAVVLSVEQIAQLEKIIFAKTYGPRKHAVMEKSLIGKNIQVILSKIGMHVDDNIRLAIAPVGPEHPLVWTEQMMPVLPVVRMPDVDSAIDLAKEAEHGFRHTAVMHSKNLDNLSRMARVMDCSIFVKNGPSLAGLGYGGEGYTSFTIASPTGDGLTGPRTFSRERRCILVDHFRIV